MNNERAIFSVTPDALRMMDRQQRIVESRLLVESTWQCLTENQPELMSYIREVYSGEGIDSAKYGTGVVTTYLGILNQHELSGEEPFVTRDEVGLHVFNLGDQNYFTMTPQVAEHFDDSIAALFADEGVSHFLHLLAKSSPEYERVISSQLLESSGTFEEKMSLIRGVYDVYMPFYKKRESEVMYDELIWLPGLAAAFDSGYYQYGNDYDDEHGSNSAESDRPV